MSYWPDAGCADLPLIKMLKGHKRIAGTFSSYAVWRGEDRVLVVYDQNGGIELSCDVRAGTIWAMPTMRVPRCPCCVSGTGWMYAVQSAFECCRCGARWRLDGENVELVSIPEGLAGRMIVWSTERLQHPVAVTPP